MCIAYPNKVGLPPVGLRPCSSPSAPATIVEPAPLFLRVFLTPSSAKAIALSVSCSFALAGGGGGGGGGGMLIFGLRKLIIHSLSVL